MSADVSENQLEQTEKEGNTSQQSAKWFLKSCLYQGLSPAAYVRVHPGCRTIKGCHPGTGNTLLDNK